MNLPVAPMDHVSPTCAVIRAASSSGWANSTCAAGPAGSRKMCPAISCAFSIIQFVTGASSRQRPMGSMSTSLPARRG